MLRPRFPWFALVVAMFASSAESQDLRDAVVDSLAVGRFSDRIALAYERYAIAEVRTHASDRVAPEFWDWLDSSDDVRDPLVWAIAAAEVTPKAIVCLDRLRRASAADVESLPDLAIGFALAWSGGEDDAAPARRWTSWSRGRSAIPTMEASFLWYAKHRKRMVFPLRDACWKLLVYTALNDVPLDEREWVLRRYRGKRTEDLRDVFGQVPYIAGGLDGKAETLENMIEHGGVCTVNTQFQMCVMRTLGIPATFAGGPGHCWPAWIEGTAKRLEFGRVNDLGNADGTLGEWGGGSDRYESDLRLLAQGLSRSRAALRAADISAAAVRAAGDRAPERSFELLARVLDRNPFAVEAWRAVAELAVTGRAPARRAATRLRKLSTAFRDFMPAILTVLRACVPAEPHASVDRAIDDVVASLVTVLVEHGRFADDAKRLHVRFLEHTGQAARAHRLRFELLLDGRKPFDRQNGRTACAGGGGGSPFEQRKDADARLVGFRYSLGEYFGHRVLASLQPIYRTGSATTFGSTIGKPNGATDDVAVPVGCEVVGLDVSSGDVVDGFALVYAPSKSVAAELDEVGFSRWIGGGSPGVLLGGTGDRVEGIHGRHGALVDAIGLLTSPR